ncbi:hypothetical protein PQE68_gp176 [Bacillus phage vB_BanS_Sophrita]|uniref:Uncharacterized protein n=1 Tax=Bacillus phage vB_BanS_Sophrita TaxID=2894790 RepID=A0AAE8YUD5_9CAUD|nr:hypothetical protein PQE68_gp176 [Bacillus phage vB_BanS_Sophrita]UGO50767.1 hypothetical protein SOPHRITA_176 [Bacillus phage vB_BanS_Sophrita]
MMFMKIINDIKVINETSKASFETKLKTAIRDFQRVGLTVEIQFNAGSRDQYPNIEFSALVIGYENPVNKG